MCWSFHLNFILLLQNDAIAPFVHVRKDFDFVCIAKQKLCICVRMCIFVYGKEEEEGYGEVILWLIAAAYFLTD